MNAMKMNTLLKNILIYYLLFSYSSQSIPLPWPSFFVASTSWNWKFEKFPTYKSFFKLRSGELRSIE